MRSKPTRPKRSGPLQKDHTCQSTTQSKCRAKARRMTSCPPTERATVGLPSNAEGRSAYRTTRGPKKPTDDGGSENQRELVEEWQHGQEPKIKLVVRNTRAAFLVCMVGLPHPVVVVALVRRREACRHPPHTQPAGP